MADDRMTALGTELVELHDQLRQDLADLRADLAAGGRGRDLRTHCLAFCSALHRHHTGEDTGAFPLLAAQFPELRPVLDKLAEDHWLVAGLLRRLDAIATSLPPDPDPATIANVLGELDGLTAIVESHFSYEERTIVTALNALRTDTPPATLFGTGPAEER